MVLDEVKDKYKNDLNFFKSMIDHHNTNTNRLQLRKKLRPVQKDKLEESYDSNELNRFHYKLVDDKLVWEISLVKVNLIVE